MGKGAVLVCRIIKFECSYISANNIGNRIDKCDYEKMWVDMSSNTLFNYSLLLFYLGINI